MEDGYYEEFYDLWYDQNVSFGARFQLMIILNFQPRMPSMDKVYYCYRKCSSKEVVRQRFLCGKPFVVTITKRASMSLSAGAYY